MIDKGSYVKLLELDTYNPQFFWKIEPFSYSVIYPVDLGCVSPHDAKWRCDTVFNWRWIHRKRDNKDYRVVTLEHMSPSKILDP